MNWQQQWINGILAEIPMGSYRRRVEAELRDHLDSQCRALMEDGRTSDRAQAETLSAMGDPETLREEYKAAWRRSLPGRLEELRRRLKAWAAGCAVMLGVHFLVAIVRGTMFDMAISLPGDSQNKWVRLIRGAMEHLSNSWLWLLLPLIPALFAGAYYLGRKFQTSRRPVWQISMGLSFHWAFITATHVWFKALDHHRTFLGELKRYMTYNYEYYSLTFALCVLLAVVFGHMSVRIRRSAAA